MDGSLSLRDRGNAAAGVSKIYLQGLRDKAIEHYRDRDYAAALECLNDAIEQDYEAPLTVIDKRAATLIKLNDLDSALSDARCIVKRDRTNAIGFLRLGQILQQQKKPESALKLYEKGLRCVSLQDAHFKTLQHNRNKLNSLLAPQRASDPLTLLPNELALMLFEYLDFKDIVAMSRVSKSWRETLTSNPYLWTELDFSHARKIVSLTAVRAYVKYSKNNVIILKSSRSELDQRPSFFYVATHCHTLQELYYDQPAAGETLCRAAKAMPSLRKVSTSSRCRISLEFCLDILQSCQSLQHVEFLSVFVPGIISESPNTRELSNLRTLTLNMCGQSPNTDIERVFETITRVRCLTLQGWKFPSYLANHKEFGFSSFVYLEHLNVSRSRFDRLPSLPRSIREISFEATDFLGHGQVIDLQDLPNLIRLSLPRNHIIEKTLDLLHKLLLSGHGKLLGLDASNRHFPAGDVECLVREGYFDAINDLMLGQSGVNDAIAELLSERCKSLATLEIPHTQITGVGVKALVNGLRPSLKYLGLDYCNQVSPDAVHWARKQGLQVSYKFPDKKMKGRKVRGG